MLKLFRLVLKILPASLAFPLIRFLAAIIPRPAIRSNEQVAMDSATKIYFGDNRQNVAWSWGAGPLVILVHGWGGRAAQLAPIAQHIASLGYRAVAVEITGHGSSPQHNTRWEYFFRDIASVSAAFDEQVYAYVGHSAGALTMMAARVLKGIHAQRYICICAPSYPFPAIQFLQQKLNPKPAVVEAYKQYIAADFGVTWAELQGGSSYQDDGAELLLCYGMEDRIVSPDEGDKMQKLYPNSELHKISAYGHMQIFSSPELAHTIGIFLKKTPT